MACAGLPLPQPPPPGCPLLGAASCRAGFVLHGDRTGPGAARVPAEADGRSGEDLGRSLLPPGCFLPAAGRESGLRGACRLGRFACSRPQGMKITADTTVLVRALGQDDPEQVPAHQGLGPCQEGNAISE